MARKLSLALCFFLAAALPACEQKPAEQPEEPPEWIKEAHERSKRHLEQEEADRTGDEEPARAAEREQKRAIERSLLWRVDGPNGPLYLFGTIHGGLSDISWDDLPPDVHEAFASSETVVLEADGQSINQQAISRMALLPQGDSLREILGERRFDKLSMGVSVPAAMLDRFQPWMAYAMLSRGIIGEGKSVDEIISIEARVTKKELAYLESVQSQLDLFRDHVDASFLSAMLDELDEMSAHTQKLITAYRAGDVERMESVAFLPQYVEQYPEFYDDLFEARNRAWLSRIEDHLERGNVFVAVGAGHLVGNVSVVHMLEQEGHEVVRVEAPSKTADKMPSEQQE